MYYRTTTMLSQPMERPEIPSNEIVMTSQPMLRSEMARNTPAAGQGAHPGVYRGLGQAC